MLIMTSFNFYFKMNGDFIMNKNMNTTAAITGVALTMVAGTAAYMMSSKSANSQKKKLKKNATKALKTVSGVIDNVSNMMGY